MLYNFKNLLELSDFFREEKTCYEFLAGQIWDNGKPVCPHCESSSVYTTKSRSTKPSKRDVPEYRCANKDCKKKFSVTTGTIFESSKLSLRTWFAAIYLITSHKKGISSCQLARDLKITQRTAWFLLHRIRKMYIESAPEMLGDVVQLDETYVGGKNKNRHRDKKKPHAQGRSHSDKTPVFGARGLTGKVKTMVVPNVESATLKPVIEKWVKKDSMIVTDEWKAYNTAISKDYFHVTVEHGMGLYANGGFSSNGIENFWSMFKRGIIGIYHQVSPKHLSRYCDEFAYRYNTKDLKDCKRFQKVVGNAGKVRLKWVDLVGENKKMGENTCFINPEEDYFVDSIEIYNDDSLPLL